jgi:hypothetical protein
VTDVTEATYAERTLDYLWSIAPDGATNRQIADRLSIRSHQTVYLLTQDLLRRGLVDSVSSSVVGLI